MTHHADDWSINRLRPGYFISFYACRRWCHGNSSKIIGWRQTFDRRVKIDLKLLKVKHITTLTAMEISFWRLTGQTIIMVPICHYRYNFWISNFAQKSKTFLFLILDTINVYRIQTFSIKFHYCFYMQLFVVQLSSRASSHLCYFR